MRKSIGWRPQPGYVLDVRAESASAEQRSHPEDRARRRRRVPSFSRRSPDDHRPPAVVTDIHHGADTFAKKGTAALGLFDEFRRFVAEAKPDAVLDLGDRISDVSREVDLTLETEEVA